MTDDDLRASVEEMTHINRMLTTENELIEQFLRRKDPQSLEKLSLIVESARQAQKISRRHGSGVSLPGSYAKSASSRTASGSQRLSVAAPAAKGLAAKLTAAHRTELANREVDLMRREWASFEGRSKKERLNGEIRLEELKYRLRDMDEALRNFEAQVVRQVDPISKKIPAEKFVRFVENQLRLAEEANDKLNLKMITTRQLIRQARRQIDLGAEVGKTLRPIDFERVAIENEHLAEENERNGRSLAALKRIKRHYSLALKYRKEGLAERKSRLRVIERKLELGERENVDLERRRAVTRREVKWTQSRLDDIKELRDNYEKPEVADFLRVQKQLQEELRRHKRLKRRRKIQLFT
ncbi:coiled-coil domain-containing protein 113-like, partial [Copidosoma floridanum]|uniref:coiled-coil domain-containing protein 113-like n=1 Tax=Copidosoma floridanum TaxID=29053 RepID=UPI000C6F9100